MSHVTAAVVLVSGINADPRLSQLTRTIETIPVVLGEVSTAQASAAKMALVRTAVAYRSK